MHRMKAGSKGRVGMLAAIGLLVAAVGVLPMFGGTAHAAGLNLDGTVSLSEFIIPTNPITLLDVAVANTTQPTLNLKVRETDAFPQSGQLLLGHTEVMTYSSKKSAVVTEMAMVTGIKSPGFCAGDESAQTAITVTVDNTGKPGLVSAPNTVYFWDGTNPACDGFWSVTNPGGGPVTKPQVILVRVPWRCGDKAGDTMAGTNDDNQLETFHCGFNITARGGASGKVPGSIKKDHAEGTQVKLATLLTKKISVPTSGPKTAANAANAGAQTTLSTKITEAAVPSFTIGITNGGNFPNTGFITVSHQTTKLGEGSTEYFEYNNSGGNPCGAAKPGVGPSSLCIIARAQQPNKEVYQHDADGFPQPGGTPGRSLVNLHFQLQVKSCEGFFPSGSLMVYDVDGANNIINAELIGRSIQVAPDPSNIKLSDCDGTAGDEIHVVSRGASPSTFKKTDIVQHNVNSIVTGADGNVVSRAVNVSPIPVTFTDVNCDATCQANSVGTFPVTYAQSEPNGPPKITDKGSKELLVPLAGGPLILLNFFGNPFLSTGGFTHPIFGEVPLVDTNGTADGVLNLVSPCVEDFTPGVNLRVNVTIQVDKTFKTDDVGTINVVLDSIHDAVHTGAGDDCDDPSGTARIDLHSYIWGTDPNADNPANTDSNKSDDDTDGDGCTDDRELQPDPGDGGLRDPWNPYDYSDVNHDGAINVFDDILGIASRFGATAPGDEEFDRGATYGPFDRNRSQPDGTVNVFDDILVAAGQFGNRCPHNHANYPSGTWIFGDHP